MFLAQREAKMDTNDGEGKADSVSGLLVLDKFFPSPSTWDLSEQMEAKRVRVSESKGLEVPMATWSRLKT